MHSNIDLIHRFYSAFDRRDPDGMAACYHTQVSFSDPVFPELHGAGAVAMWQMLCQRGKDLQIQLGAVRADDRNGTAVWEAWYTFSATGRRVHNRIEAEFHFQDGAVIRHIDRFPFWSWAGQALGPAGWLLGWSGAFRQRVRAEAAAALSSFRAGRTPTA